MTRFFLIILAFPFLFHPLQAQQGDHVEFIDQDPAGCCFDFLIENTHLPESPLDLIRIRSITPGVTIRAGAQGPWQVEREDPLFVEFGSGGQDLEVGKMLEGFNICYSRLSGIGQQFRIVWSTELGGQVVSTDTVTLECEPVQGNCDSVVVASIAVSGQPEGSCCYEFTIKNRNLPPSVLDGITLTTFSTGVVIVGTPSGPWPVKTQSATSVTFDGQGDTLSAGKDLGGFRVCVRKSNGKPGPVQFLWRTQKGVTIRCEGLVDSYCTPHLNDRPDELILSNPGNCTRLLGFRNTHVPQSNIDGFRISMLTPGATIDSSYGIPGWRIGSRTPLAVQFRKDGAALATGDSAAGFRFVFNAPKNGSFQVAWCTLLGAATVTCDTISFQCDTVVETACDSLLIDADATTCSFDLGFVNTHLPASDINDFHIRLRTPGATISAVAAPMEWFVADSSATQLIFRTASSPVPAKAVQRGFRVAVTPAVPGAAVVYEWCTSRNDSILCCMEDSVRCESQDARDDSVAVSVAQDYCSYAFRVANVHVPESDLDVFSVSLDDAATLLLDAVPPTGWSIDTLSEAGVRFRKDDTALPTGEEAGDFVLQLLPSFLDTRIPYTWCTEMSGMVLSCDTGSAFCEAVVVQADDVDVVSNTERPCCFEFEVQNTHLPRSVINGFNVEILTPDVTLFASTVEDADQWTHTGNSTRIVWRRVDGGLEPGEQLDGLIICFDNNAIGNGDFEVLWQTVSDGLVLSEDTVTIKCDRTLQVELRSDLIPDRFQLYQNFPNPFNPTTTISFDVPRPTNLMLTLYDASGRLVMDLGSGYYQAGSYRIQLDASRLSSGTYFCQLRSAGYTQSRPILLLR